MSLQLVATLEAHQERVWCVAWSPIGSLLASCGADKTIRVWGMEGDKWICKTSLLDGHQRTIRSVRWSPCGGLLASTSFDGTTCIWDKRSGGEFQCTSTLEGHENEVKCVSWSNCGDYLATCSRDKSVWIWDVLENGEEFECASVLLHHSQDVKYILWHPTELLLASASYDNTVKLYREDDDDWSCVATMEGHDSTVWSLAYDPSGQRLASCSADRTVRIWQALEPPGDSSSGSKEGTWSCVTTLTGYHERDIYSIDWSKSSLLATGGGDDTLRIFEEVAPTGADSKATFKEVCKEKVHEGDINCVTWNPHTHTQLATCSDDNKIKIWTFS